MTSLENIWSEMLKKLASLLSGFLLLVGAKPAAAQSNYQPIINEGSAYCLDTNGLATNGGLVRMWQCQRHPNQLWLIQQASGGFRIRNQASGFCLDVDGPNAFAGAEALRMWSCASHPNQTWQRISAGTDIHGAALYRFMNQATGLCLDFNASAATNGARPRLARCESHSNQTWKIPTQGATSTDLTFEFPRFIMDTSKTYNSIAAVVGSYVSPDPISPQQSPFMTQHINTFNRSRWRVYDPPRYSYSVTAGSDSALHRYLNDQLFSRISLVESSIKSELMGIPDLRVRRINEVTLVRHMELTAYVENGQILIDISLEWWCS